MTPDSEKAARIVPEVKGGVPAVVLPCSPDQFREFIAGLLGRPQTIEGFVDGPFEVTKQNVENLHHLIDQRILSQNEATLVQFTARVEYDNNSSVLLNSLRDFLSYNEVKPLKSSALHLSWTYLMKFPMKDFPEKQVIQISFKSDTANRRLISPHQIIEFTPGDWAGGTMSFRIEHTDRTWGTDMESLIGGHLQLLQKPVSRLRRFTNEYSGTIGFISAALALLISTSLGYRITVQFAAETTGKMLKTSPASASLEALARQLNLLTDLVASGIWTRFSLLLLVIVLATVIGAIVLGAVVGGSANQPGKSFVLLTSKAVADRDAYIKALEHSWYRLGAWIVATLALGVASDLIFYLGLKYFAGSGLVT